METRYGSEMNVGGRIEQERKAQGLTQEDIASRVRRMGVKLHQTAVDKMEKRDAKRPRYIREIAAALGITEDWLITGKGPKYRDDADKTPTTQVSIVSWVSAGRLMGNDIGDIEIGRIAVSGLDSRGDWIALRVTGDSMDRISPPDSVIFINRKDKKLVPNACYVIATLDGETTYKRFRPGPPPRFEPVSTNPEHEPIFFDQEPEIVGRVRASILDTL